MSSSSETRFIKLKSSDKEIFEVNEAAAGLSQLMKNMIEDDCTRDEIPVPQVKAKILGMVLEWCKEHAKSTATEKELKEWDDEFVNVDEEILYHLLLAADYLAIKDLVAQLIQKVADMIKGKTPEQIREMLKIKNDFPPEEEEKVRRDNAWAFDY